MKNILLAVIFVMAFSGFETNAQVVYIPQMDPVAVYLQQQVNQQMILGTIRTEEIVGGKKERSSNAQAAASAKPTRNVTEFTMATGGWLSSEGLSKATGKNPAEIRQTKQMFDALLDQYQAVASKDGFPANDLAYGFEYFIVNNYNIYNDLLNQDPTDSALMKPSGNPLLALQHRYSRKPSVTIPMERAVYEQVKNFFSANPTIAKLTDQQKQEYTEMYAIITNTNFSMYETAGKNEDAELFARARSMAKESLEKTFNVSADKIKITANGVKF